MATTGGSSTSDGPQSHDEGRKRSSGGASRRSAKEAGSANSTSSGTGKGKGKRAEGATRVAALRQSSSPDGRINAVETDASLKVLGGGQPLVDDFDDADFEARKVRQGSHGLVSVGIGPGKRTPGCFRNVTSGFCIAAKSLRSLSPLFFRSPGSCRRESLMFRWPTV